MLLDLETNKVVTVCCTVHEKEDREIEKCEKCWKCELNLIVGVHCNVKGNKFTSMLK